MQKSLLPTNDLNDVTAAPFSMSFSQLPAAKNGAAVMSLRSFIQRRDFSLKNYGKNMDTKNMMLNIGLLTAFHMH